MHSVVHLEHSGVRIWPVPALCLDVFGRVLGFGVGLDRADADWLVGPALDNLLKEVIEPIK